MTKGILQILKKQELYNLGQLRFFLGTLTIFSFQLV